MKRLLYIGIFISMVTGATAQRAAVQRAAEFLQQAQYDSARHYIELAVGHEETAGWPLVQYYRGFIFKGLYTQNESQDPFSTSRGEAISSFMLFLQKDTTGKYDDSAIKSLNYLGTTLFNDAARAMDRTDPDVAIECYDEYKVVINYINPQKDFREQDIRFNLVLGTTYSDLYEQDREAREAFFQKSVAAYEKVLEIDPNHESANYNLAILYYNEGVHLIRNLPPDAPLTKLITTEEKTVELFRTSCPFMIRAYLKNPCKKETLIGIAGIFWGLNEYEFSDSVMEGLKLLKENEANGTSCDPAVQTKLKHHEVISSYFSTHYENN